MAAKFIDVRIDGFEGTLTNFRRLPYVLQGKAIRPALRVGAGIVRDRVQMLAPRRTGRLAGGRWTLRAATKRRNLVGIRVEAPRRDALGIPAGAKGFYPFSLEFGWHAGRAVQGPVDLGSKVTKRDKNGRLYRTYAKTRRQAVAEMNAHRKIAGRRYMHAALFGARAQVIAAVGAALQRNVNALTQAAIQAADTGGDA